MQCTTKNCQEIVTDGVCPVCQPLQASLPSNDFASWRARAEQLVAAIQQLEKREIEIDPNTKILGVPVVENALRDAAEESFRHCAHFCTSSDERVRLIDEANSIRRKTWF